MAFTKIESGAIAQNAVSSDSIAPGAVTVADVEDGSLTAAKLDASVQSTLADVQNKADASSVPTDISQLADNTGLFDGKLDVTADGIVIPALSADPLAPTAGQMYYNSTDGVLKNYNGVSWEQISNSFIASGGIETEANGYKIHTFTSSGTFTVSSGTKSIEYLIIAGGGSGANSEDYSGSGVGAGGAGGYRCSVAGEYSGGGLTAESPMIITAGSYSVIVGAGGAGVSSPGEGLYGSESSFNGITSIGGGRGGRSLAGGNGGSGGGGGESGGPTDPGLGTTGQGYRGGYSINTGGGGGGGGAGAFGGDTTGSAAGDGGAGVYSSITGTSIPRAGGGGGGSDSGTSPGAGGLGGGGVGMSTTPIAGSGSINTGSGGGGGNLVDASTSGAGGSGIVIIRYLI